MTTQEMINQVITALVIPILPTATAYIIFLIKTKMQTLKDQTKNQLAKSYIEILDNTVETVVNGLNQTLVEELKGVSSDGKLTEKEATEIKKRAIEQIYAILGQNANEALKEFYGDVDALISSKIEAFIRKNK